MISIIVPVYNVEKYIERCVNSLLMQTYKEFEIILIDDGSTDSSGILCDYFEKKDRRIRVIHKTNGGLSDARNVGIENAKGEYLAFIDSDDFVNPQMIEILYNNLRKYDADISVCSFRLQNEWEVINDKIDENIPQIYTGSDVMKQLFSNELETVVAWNKLYKEKLFYGIRYPKGKLHEDEFVIHHLLYQCDRIVYTPSKLYYYVQRPDSITGRWNEKRIYDDLEALEQRIIFFHDAGLYNEYCKSYKCWLRAVLRRYECCDEEMFEGSREVQKWLRRELRNHLLEMKKENVISVSQYVNYKLWAYSPPAGDAVSTARTKIDIFQGRCIRLLKKIRRFIS